jgi:hypothetical protein
MTLDPSTLEPFQNIHGQPAIEGEWFRALTTTPRMHRHVGEFRLVVWQSGESVAWSVFLGCRQLGSTRSAPTFEAGMYAAETALRVHLTGLLNQLPSCSDIAPIFGESRKAR